MDYFRPEDPEAEHRQGMKLGPRPGDAMMRPGGCNCSVRMWLLAFAVLVGLYFLLQYLYSGLYPQYERANEVQRALKNYHEQEGESRRGKFFHRFAVEIEQWWREGKGRMTEKQLRTYFGPPDETVAGDGERIFIYRYTPDATRPDAVGEVRAQVRKKHVIAFEIRFPPRPE